MKIKLGIQITHLLTWSFLLAGIFSVAGCGNTPTQGDKPMATEMSESTKSNADTKSSTPGAAAEKPAEVETTETFSAAPEALLLTPIEILSKSNRNVPQRDKTQPKHVIDYCVKQPYAKYKKQVKKGIADAWADTQAGKYGVGFRNKKEYNQWNKTQQNFFLHMFDTCRTVALCESKNKKTGKKTSCKVEKAIFTAWQDSAKLFADKVKVLKNQQPPALCGLQPKNTDVSLCFSKRADQIDNACSGEICQELSQCWRSVAMKDDVIRQAESSCRFSGQKLSECRGYIGAIKRRKDRFTDCNNAQNDINLTLEP